MKSRRRDAQGRRLGHSIQSTSTISRMKCAAVVESEWPELAHKLPPQKPQGRADQLFLYLASFCSSHLRPSGLAIQRSAASLVLCKVRCLSDSR